MTRGSSEISENSHDSFQTSEKNNQSGAANNLENTSKPTEANGAKENSEGLDKFTNSPEKNNQSGAANNLENASKPTEVNETKENPESLDKFTNSCERNSQEKGANNLENASKPTEVNGAKENPESLDKFTNIPERNNQEKLYNWNQEKLDNWKFEVGFGLVQAPKFDSPWPDSFPNYKDFNIPKIAFGKAVGCRFSSQAGFEPIVISEFGGNEPWKSYSLSDIKELFNRGNNSGQGNQPNQSLPNFLPSSEPQFPPSQFLHPPGLLSSEAFQPSPRSLVLDSQPYPDFSPKWSEDLYKLDSPAVEIPNLNQNN